MKKLLFPTDFSDRSQRAFTYALHLAKKLNIGICSLHVYSINIAHEAGPSETVKELREQEQIDELESYRKAAQKMHEQAVTEALQEVHVEHILEEGEVEDTILEVSKRENFELIVMSTRSTVALRDRILGSVTTRIVEDASLPVLAVPENAVFDGITRIAYATNFDALDRVKIERVSNWAEQSNATLHCIHVNVDNDREPDEVQMDNLKAALPNRDKINFQIIDHDDFYEGVNQYIDEHKIDVVAMLTHKHTLLQRLFSSSAAQKMTFQAKVPLLALHEQGE